MGKKRKNFSGGGGGLSFDFVIAAVPSVKKEKFGIPDRTDHKQLPDFSLRNIKERVRLVKWRGKAHGAREKLMLGASRPRQQTGIHQMEKNFLWNGTNPNPKGAITLQMGRERLSVPVVKKFYA